MTYEHKLLTGGGEEYLAFARGRLKAMRRLKLNHGTQKFVIDFTTIVVRTDGDHDHITIQNNEPEILSGAVKKGEIVSTVSTGSTTTTKKLRSFKPTQQCWKYPLKSDPAKSPTSYSDEERLAVRLSSSLAVPTDYPYTYTQYGDVCSSMYSGLMAKVVQIILGLGIGKKAKADATGVQLEYLWRWSDCHGVVLDPDGKPWLIRISEVFGVLAMKLPMLPHSETKALLGSKQKVLKETYKLLGGIPSGGSFPWDMTAGLADGSIQQSLAGAGLSAYFNKNSYSDDLGWSFNAKGTEAHNTAWDNIPISHSGSSEDVFWGYHYKLAFSFVKNSKGKYIFSAALTEVSANKLSFAATFSFASRLLGEQGDRVIPNNGPFQSGTPTVLACHIDDKLVLVKTLGGPASIVTQTVTGSADLIPALDETVTLSFGGALAGYTAYTGQPTSQTAGITVQPAHYEWTNTVTTLPSSGLIVVGTDYESASVVANYSRTMVRIGNSFFSVDQNSGSMTRAARGGSWCLGCRDGLRMTVYEGGAWSTSGYNYLHTIPAILTSYVSVIPSPYTEFNAGDGPVHNLYCPIGEDPLTWIPPPPPGSSSLGTFQTIYPMTPTGYPALPPDTGSSSGYRKVVMWDGQMEPYVSPLAPTYSELFAQSPAEWDGSLPIPNYRLTASVFGSAPQMVYLEATGGLDGFAHPVCVHTVGDLADVATFKPNFYAFIGYTS